MPLSESQNAGKKFCNYPCLDSEYLYWDGSCLDQCSAPLVSLTEGNPMVRNFCVFPCAPSEYLYPEGRCESSCNITLTERIQNQRHFCGAPCPTGEYLYWNGSCIHFCEASLTPRSEGSKLYCDYPCPPREYLYWNGSCIGTCDSPLEVRINYGNLFCDFPCASPSDYLYWDRSCEASCSMPLVSISEGNPLVRKFCLFGSCLSGEYLYWNSTCSSACDYPLTTTTQKSRSFCEYPCSASDYLFWNASCLPACPYPHIIRIESSRQYCDYPCQASEFLYWNGSCISQCNSPLSTRLEFGKKYCDYLCPIGQILYWNGSCLPTGSCTFPLSLRMEGTFSFCDFQCGPTNYLYYDGSCAAACTASLKPRTTTDGYNFCDFPCLETEVAYWWDGSCSSECTPPFAAQVIPLPRSVLMFCIFPCSDPNDFLYWNGTCSSTCPTPLTSRLQNSRKICEYPCSYDKFLYWNTSCLESCPTPLISYIGTTQKHCYYPCSTSQYLYWNGSCSSNCDAPLSHYSIGTNKYCEYTCGPNEYLYWDGTCSSSCPLPLTQIIEGSPIVRKFCQYTCNSTDYLYWNGTCASLCPSLFIQETINNRKICKTPCNTTQYLYWDGSCLASCDFPLASKTEGGVRYCNYPCDAAKYLHWDGRCELTCNITVFKPRYEKGFNFCDFPCAASEYLYWNHSCSSQCPSPFIPKQEGTTVIRKYCLFACTGFLKFDGSCVDACDLPYRTSVSDLGRYCNLPCEDGREYYHTELGMCKLGCLSPNIISHQNSYQECLPSSASPVINNTKTFESKGGLIGTLLEAPLENGAFTLVKVVKPMQYLRYLDIKFPPRLERLGLSRGVTINSVQSPSRLLSDMAENIMMKTSLPAVFAKHNLDSVFIANLSVTLIFIACILVAAILFTILEKISRAKKWELAEAIFVRLRIITRWNLVIMILATSIDDVILYTSLEFRTLNLSSDAPSVRYISFILCLLAIVVEISLLVGAYYTVRRQRSVTSTVAPNNYKVTSNFESEWQDYQVIFRGFKNNYTLNQFFFLLYVIRIGFPMLITVCATNVALFVVIIQVLTSVFMVGYIILMRPFKSKINHIQILIFEMTIFLMNICILILACMNIGNDSFSIVLGDIIILGNEALNFSTYVFIVIRCIMETSSIIQYIKEQKPSKTHYVLWFRLLGIFFQQINFGFEEINEELPLSKNSNQLKKKGNVRLPSNSTITQNERNSSISNSTIDLEGSKNPIFISSMAHNFRTSIWGTDVSGQQSKIEVEKSKGIKTFEWKSMDSSMAADSSILDNSTVEKRNFIHERDALKDKTIPPHAIIEEEHQQEDGQLDNSTKEIIVEELSSKNKKLVNLKSHYQNKQPSSMLQNILKTKSHEVPVSEASRGTLSNPINVERSPARTRHAQKEKRKTEVSSSEIKLQTIFQGNLNESSYAQEHNDKSKEYGGLTKNAANHNESKHFSKYDDSYVLPSTERGLLREEDSMKDKTGKRVEASQGKVFNQSEDKSHKQIESFLKKASFPSLETQKGSESALPKRKVPNFEWKSSDAVEEEDTSHLEQQVNL